MDSLEQDGKNANIIPIDAHFPCSPGLRQDAFGGDHP